MAIRILLADDHPVVRFGIYGMLAGQPDFVIVAEASDGAQAVDLAATLRPDIVLMDLRMPVMSGVVALRKIALIQPVVRVLILSTFDNEQDIQEALNAGAMGYILKDTPREELYRAIRLAVQGQIILSRSVSDRTQQSGMKNSNKLSEREIMILSLVAQGRTNLEIGKCLFISEATVKTHLKHVYEKLGVTDRASAVAVAIERRFIRSGD